MERADPSDSPTEFRSVCSDDFEDSSEEVAAQQDHLLERLNYTCSELAAVQLELAGAVEREKANEQRIQELMYRDRISSALWSSVIKSRLMGADGHLWDEVMLCYERWMFNTFRSNNRRATHELTEEAMQRNNRRASDVLRRAMARIRNAVVVRVISEWHRSSRLNLKNQLIRSAHVGHQRSALQTMLYVVCRWRMQEQLGAVLQWRAACLQGLAAGRLHHGQEVAMRAFLSGVRKEGEGSESTRAAIKAMDLHAVMIGCLNSPTGVAATRAMSTQHSQKPMDSFEQAERKLVEAEAAFQDFKEQTTPEPISKSAASSGAADVNWSPARIEPEPLPEGWTMEPSHSRPGKRVVI